MVTNIATSAMLQELKTQIFNEIFDARYPVGKGRYVQFDGMPEPATIRGTWTIDTDYEGRTIIGSGGTYTLGATGGENTHTMTVEELVFHNHIQKTFDNSGAVRFATFGSGGSIDANKPAVGTYVQNGGEFLATNETGNSKPFNIMQKYKVVAVWKRTA